ncbi:choice-of-anchor P family protein [Streptomyces sp. NPDC004069]
MPASWDVVDLRKNPDACVRFDRPAVYLGAPGTRQDCPAKAFGRTQALLIQPADRSKAAGRTPWVTEDRVSRLYEAAADGIAVTASYGEDRKLIQDVLRSASLPVDAARPKAPVPRPALAAALPADATSFQGKGFDRCAAPPSGQMDAWKDASPYGAVGVYIGGENAGCGVTVDADWMRAQYDKGWRYFPIYVGPQASADAGSCQGTCSVIGDPVPDGAAAARDAVNQAAGLGLGKGSVLYYNMEHYDPAHSATAVAFLQSWTATLHELDYRSGAYGSLSSLATDLVKADGGGYLQPDVIDFARWDDRGVTDDPDIPDRLWADHQRIKQYSGDITETYGGVTLDLDADQLDVGEGVVQPPPKKDTTLTWTGPAGAANGSPVELSARLTEKDGGTPVEGRKVAFALGTGDGAQTCEGTTDAKGGAGCTVTSVDQPLDGDATAPVTAQFAGDDAYKASDTSATLKLQYVTGRAFGLSADVLAPLPLSIAPTPDTGRVRTAGAESKAPPCTRNINVLVLTAQAPCAEVTTTVGPNTASATATLAKATIGLPGLPVVKVSGATATSTSNCTARKGSTRLDLSIAGIPVTVPDTPNHTIDLGGAKIIINEQTETADGLTVNAFHLTALGGVDIVIASSTSGAHNCV